VSWHQDFQLFRVSDVTHGSTAEVASPERLRRPEAEAGVASAPHPPDFTIVASPKNLGRIKLTTWPTLEEEDVTSFCAALVKLKYLELT
jgi:hypothetical protein